MIEQTNLLSKEIFGCCTSYCCSELLNTYAFNQLHVYRLCYHLINLQILKEELPLELSHTSNHILLDTTYKLSLVIRLPYILYVCSNTVYWWGRILHT